MLDRRNFLFLIPAATVLGGFFKAGPAQAVAGSNIKTVGAIETLMCGHGLLLRALIIYGAIGSRMDKGQSVDPGLISKTAKVFEDYLEAFHEKAEEKFIFGPLEKSNVNAYAIQELKIQHGTGYELTYRITKLADAGKQTPELVTYLSDFIAMYRHHMAWEDTVVFPAYDAMKNRRELGELAESLEDEQKKVLGHSGLQSYVDQLAEVEQQLGIYDLSTSTPKLS